jgi:hypothetical protein
MVVGQFETDVTTSDYLTRRPFTALAPIASYGKIFDSSFAPSDGYDRVIVDGPLLPWPRGPLSAMVVSALQRQSGTLGATPPLSHLDVLSDDDFQLALYLCYEMNYCGLAIAEWEWDPGLLNFRTELERIFVERLRDEIGHAAPKFPLEVMAALDDLVADCATSSLTTYLSQSGTVEQFREFCVHRSAHQQRTLDSERRAILGRTDADQTVGVAIQFDEFGSGDAARIRANFLGAAMTALGLDPSYGSYLEILPGVTLATANLSSLFALHPRWRAALVGHLAVCELTSMESMERYGRALYRFGMGPVGRRFSQVDVVVDARRPVLARNQIVAGLLGAGPQLGADLLFGAGAVMMLEQRFGDHLLDAWTEDRSSLVAWELFPRQLSIT